MWNFTFFLFYLAYVFFFFGQKKDHGCVFICIFVAFFQSFCCFFPKKFEIWDPITTPLGVTWRLTAHGKSAVTCKIRPLHAYSICYWEVSRHFTGWGILCLRWVFMRSIFCRRGKFPTVNFPGKILHLGFCRIPIRNSFICLAFPLSTRFSMWRYLEGIFSGFGRPEKNYHGRGDSRSDWEND